MMRTCSRREVKINGDFFIFCTEAFPIFSRCENDASHFQSFVEMIFKLIFSVQPVSPRVSDKQCIVHAVQFQELRIGFKRNNCRFRRNMCRIISFTQNWRSMLRPFTRFLFFLSNFSFQVQFDNEDVLHVSSINENLKLNCHENVSVESHWAIDRVKERVRVWIFCRVRQTTKHLFHAIQNS